MTSRRLSSAALAGLLLLLALEGGPVVAALVVGGASVLALRFHLLPRSLGRALGDRARRAVNLGALVTAWAGFLGLLIAGRLPEDVLLPALVVAFAWYVLDLRTGRVIEAVYAGGVGLGTVLALTLVTMPAAVGIVFGVAIGTCLVASFALIDRERVREATPASADRREIRVDWAWIPVCAALALLALPFSGGPRGRAVSVPGSVERGRPRVMGFNPGRLTLGAGGRLEPSGRTAFEVSVWPKDARTRPWSHADGDPGAPPLFWRGAILDRFDDGTFVASGGEWIETSRPRAGGIGTLSVRQVFRIVPHGHRELFALAPAVRRVSGAYDIMHGCVMARRRVDEDFTYEVESVILDPAARPALEGRDAAPAGGPWIEPPPLSEGAARLASDLAGRARSDYGRAQAVERYLKAEGGFRYAREDPNGGEGAIDRFILETRAGHCEYFAAAMVVLLREAGIPARVVAGYRGGTWREDIKGYRVRDSDAHAWVEVPFEGAGWVPFDPTPAESRTEAARAAELAVLDAAPGVRPPGGGLAEHLGFAGWAGAVALVLGHGIILLGRRGLRPDRSPDAGSGVGGRLRALLESAGPGPRPAATLEELVLEAGQLRPDVLPDVHALVAFVYRCRYGLETPGPDELRSARTMLDRIAAPSAEAGA